jgi:predicted dehydrogenase
MNIKPVRTAIIGCGMISEAYLSTMSSKFQILELVACCDRNTEKAEIAAQNYGLKVLSLEEILKDESIELVVNLTTSPVHYAVNKDLLKAGKHVYTEKVLSVSLEEAKELVELANEKQLYLGAAPDTFLGAAIQTARYVIDSGMIGEITSCNAVLTRDVDTFACFAPFTTKAGGGIAFDVGIYYITALLSMLGAVKTVTGVMNTRNPERTSRLVNNLGETYTLECENLMSGTMIFENGMVGSLLFDSNSVMTMPERPILTIHGTQGIMYMNDPNLFGGEVHVLLKGNNEPFVMQQTHPFQEEFRGLGVAEMAWSLRKGRPNRASKEMAYHALEVLHGIAISSEKRAHYDLKSSFELTPAIPRGYFTGLNINEIEESAIAL